MAVYFFYHTPLLPSIPFIFPLFHFSKRITINEIGWLLRWVSLPMDKTMATQTYWNTCSNFGIQTVSHVSINFILFILYNLFLNKTIKNYQVYFQSMCSSKVFNIIFGDSFILDQIRFENMFV